MLPPQGWFAALTTQARLMWLRQSTLLRRLCGVTGPLISTASSCRTTKSSFATAFSGP
jgi:hypothetical protein